ncbi:MAG: hypothetical protein WC947_01845 [Elusimicrobiota bacterium]
MKKFYFLILTFNLLPLTSASAAVWYQTNFNDFNTGSSFVQTAIRSTDTAAYIELGRTGATELSADSQTVGLYHMNDGGPAELSSSVQGSTVVALYHFNNGPATTLTSDANTVGLWHFDDTCRNYFLKKANRTPTIAQNWPKMNMNIQRMMSARIFAISTRNLADSSLSRRSYFSSEKATITSRVFSSVLLNNSSSASAPSSVSFSRKILGKAITAINFTSKIIITKTCENVKQYFLI